MNTQKSEFSPLEVAQQIIIDLQAQLITMHKDNAAMAKIIRGSAELEEPCKNYDEGHEESILHAGIERDGTQWYTAHQYLEIKQKEFIDMRIPHQRRIFFKFTGLIAHFYRVDNLGAQNEMDLGAGAPVNVYSPYDFPLLETAWKQAKQEMRDEEAKSIADKYLNR
jgi:hypothetical protein